jgi:hypothetical protein
MLPECMERVFSCEVTTMDVIEQGFSEMMERIKVLRQKKEDLSEEIRTNDAALLERMVKSALPLIPNIGLEMLEKGKKDGKGDIYDARYYPGRMLVLGKSEDPLEYRPDDMTRPVSSQFCVLGEDGVFREVMYTVDDVVVDSYTAEISPGEVLDLYGYDVMYMLYRAIHDYMHEESKLVGALEMTLSYVFEKE